MGLAKSKLGNNLNNLIRKKSPKRVLNLNDLEIDRLQYTHDVHRTVFEGNFSSPMTTQLEKGAKVLEFRCGPGTWSCDMSSDFKNSTFYAIDSVACFPKQKPFNTVFIKSDELTEKLPFQNDYFDFVFVRSAVLWYTGLQWKENVIPELIRILKPGGYLEIMEAELRLFDEGPKIPITTKHIKKFRTVLRSHKINPDLILDMPNILSSTNQLTDFEKDTRQCPVGNWDPKLGEWGAKLSISLILSTLITNKVINKQNRDELTKKMTLELEQANIYFKDHRIWAKKKN